MSNNIKLNFGVGFAIKCSECNGIGAISLQGQGHLPCNTCEGTGIIQICEVCGVSGEGNYLGSTQLKMACQNCNGKRVTPVIKSKQRPSWDEYFIGILEGLRLRASCPRRQCSALIVDEDNNLISTGYNGPPSGLPNCLDTPCGGEYQTPGDTSSCIALHAEHNAIYYAGEKGRLAHTLYCTTKPCLKCCLEICQTPIKRVVYLEEYADIRCEKIFEMKGIKLEKGELYGPKEK